MSDSSPSTPSKSRNSTSGWVQFDEEEAKSPKGSPLKSPSSSGVSSARGSVNSIAQAHSTTTSPQGASISVSDIQVVDEKTLRRNSLAIDAKCGPRRPHSSNSTSSHTSSMDNVNLDDQVDSRVSSHPGTQEVVVEDPYKNNIRMQNNRTYTNGEVLVTLLPVNEKFPWVTPARFRPELVPEELMAPVLTLTVEEYVQTMEKLTTDMRFTIYNICYKRILVIWIITAFVILLCLLFSGFQGLQLFACGVAWLVMNAAAIFLCMWVKLRLNKQLERCMSVINSGLLKHKIILGVDDRGKLSCHKVNLCFIYFDGTECIKKLETILSEKPAEQSANGSANGFDRESYLRDVEGFEDVEVVVSGRGGVKLDRKKERAEKLYLHYIQRWAKDFLRRRLDWIIEDLYGRTEYASNTNPRHLRTALCPCQYIEEHLRNKRYRESLNPCNFSPNPCQWCD